MPGSRGGPGVFPFGPVAVQAFLTGCDLVAKRGDVDLARRNRAKQIIVEELNQ